MKMLCFAAKILSSLSILMASVVVCLGANLRDTTNRAEYVIITPTSYYALSETLAVFRHERNSFATMVVNLDTVLAQFGEGSSPDTTLKNFIQYALNYWSDPKPQYFVLAGNTNAIPSHPEPETIYDPGIVGDTLLMIDQWFVEAPDSNGELRVKACIGRLPAWDSLGLSVMVGKTIDYENSAVGAWCSRVVCLSDYDYVNGNVFEDDANVIKSILGSLWSDTVSVNIRSDSPYHLSSTDFLNLWNVGAAIVTYSGHANQTTLSATHFFTTASVDSLNNGDRLPVCLLGGCDLMYDTRPPVSIPTHLLERNGGGAVAVISSEGLMYEQTVMWFYSSLMKSMIEKPDDPIGKSFKETKSDLGPGLIERFSFLGDPALTVRHPAAPVFVERSSSRPESFVLMQNYPNPFNPTTVIAYRLATASTVTLKVYDMLGREVKTLVNDRQAAGLHSVSFNAINLPSGVYLYELQAGTRRETKKLVLLR